MKNINQKILLYYKKYLNYNPTFICIFYFEILKRTFRPPSYNKIQYTYFKAKFIYIDKVISITNNSKQGVLNSVLIIRNSVLTMEFKFNHQLTDTT